MEFLKDYDFELKYHQGKANVVADALSRKSLQVSTMMIHQMILLEKFRDLHLDVSCYSAGISVCKVDLKNALRDQIQEAQKYDHELQTLKEQVDFSVAGDGMILFRECVFRMMPESRRQYLWRIIVANTQYTLGLPRCIKT
jgi:hypothetical protein